MVAELVDEEVLGPRGVDGRRRLRVQRSRRPQQGGGRRDRARQEAVAVPDHRIHEHEP